MCLVIFAYQCSAKYPLVVAANRDEFHARPTEPSRFWPSHPQLLAGRDLEQGGTWMGITRTGRFAAITNVRDPARTAPAPRSRGALTLNFLTGDIPARAYLEQIETESEQYAGFNLLVGDQDSLWVYSNSQGQGDNGPRALSAGMYGLSNAALDTPWPKVNLGKSALARLVDNGAPSHDALTKVVNDRGLARPEELASHGLHGDMDQALSAQFITAGVYGTRSTTSIWITSNGRAHWCERSFDDTGSETGCVEESFELVQA